MASTKAGDSSSLYKGSKPYVAPPAPAKPTNVGTIITGSGGGRISSGRSGGGGGSSPATPTPKPQAVLTPAASVLLNPQQQSAREALSARNLATQNVLAQDDSISRETNYAWQTKINTLPSDNRWGTSSNVGKINPDLVFKDNSIINKGDARNIASGPITLLVEGNGVQDVKKGMQRIITTSSTPSIPSYGGLIVSPNEANKLSGSKIPFVSTEGVTMKNALGFGQAIGSAPQINAPPTFGGVKQVYIQNVANLESAKQSFIAQDKFINQFETNPTSFRGMKGYKETSEGISVNAETFNQFFPNLGNQGLKTAQERYAALPLSTRAGLQYGEFQIGTGKFLAGLATAPINMALLGSTQIITPEQLAANKAAGKTSFFNPTGIDNSIKFSEGTLLGKYQATPVGALGKTTEIGLSLGLITLGTYKNIKDLGFKEGIGETLSYGSPIKIKSAIYSPQITSKDTTNVLSMKLTDTGRLYSGNIKGKDIIFKGIEVGGKGLIETKTPFLEIRGGGLKVTEGIAQNVKPYTTSTTPGKPINGLSTTIGRTVTIEGATTLYKKSGGLISSSYSADKNILFGSRGTIGKEVKQGVTIFKTGKAKLFYTGSGSFDKEFYINPSGSYGLKEFNVRGIEFNIGDLGNADASSLSGFKVTKLSPSSGIKSAQQTSFTGATKTTNTLTQDFAGLAKTNLVSPKTIVAPLISIPSTKEQNQLFAPQQTGSLFKSITKENLVTPQILSPAVVPRNRNRTASSFAQNVAQVQQQEQLQRQITIPAKLFDFSAKPGADFSMNNKYLLPPLDMPSLGGFAIGVPRGFGSKSKEARIAPSFSAIIGGTKATKAISVSKILGVNPFTTRGLYTKKVGPKNYIKLTDL